MRITITRLDGRRPTSADIAAAFELSALIPYGTKFYFGKRTADGVGDYSETRFEGAHLQVQVDDPQAPRGLSLVRGGGDDAGGETSGATISPEHRSLLLGIACAAFVGSIWIILELATFSR